MCLGPGILPSPCGLPGCAAPPHVFLFLLVPARAAGTTKKKTPTVPARTVIFSYPACEGNAAAIPLCRQIKKQRREGNAAAKSAMPPRNVAMHGLRNSGSHHRVPLRLSGPHTHTHLSLTPTCLARSVQHRLSCFSQPLISCSLPWPLTLALTPLPHPSFLSLLCCRGLHGSRRTMPPRHLLVLEQHTIGC